MAQAKSKISDYEKERTREVKNLGKTIRVRKLPPSESALKGLGMRTKREIIGHIAINRPEVEKDFRLEKATILREMALMKPADKLRFIEQGPIDFISDKGNRKKYEILCSNCGDKVAYCWASDDSLSDWVDLHYLTWYNAESWRGALAINVSPIDGKLGIECACGEDTRDFRAAPHMAPLQRQLMTEYSLKHRVFGTKESKFAAIAAK